MISFRVRKMPAAVALRPYLGRSREGGGSALVKKRDVVVVRPHRILEVLEETVSRPAPARWVY